MIDIYMTDPLTLKHLVSRDEWGEPTYELVALMGRVDWKTRLVRDLKGEQVVSMGLVTLPRSVAEVTHEDRIIVDGIEHAIIVIQKMADFEFSHWELYTA
jgi:hypothetical protein